MRELDKMENFNKSPTNQESLIKKKLYAFIVKFHENNIYILI